MSTPSESVSVLLSSQDFGDRLRGVTQLRQLEPETAFSMLLPLLEDVHPRVRYSAVSQLASLGQQDRTQSLELLRARLQDSEPDVQAAAADSLGALGLKDAFDDLQQLYRGSSEWLVVFSIVAALGALGDPRGFDLLVDALNSNNEMLQTVAIGSLGELADPRAASLIAPFATHADWQIRFRVAQALGTFNLPEYRSTLEALVKDEIDIVAQEAQRCLT